jgi:hypothetical protein
MRWKIPCSLVILVLLPKVSFADTFSFRLTKADKKFTCAAGTPESTATPIQVSVLVPSEVTPEAPVTLSTVVELLEGDPLKGTFEKINDPKRNIWRFSPKTKETKAKKVSVTGTVDNLPVDDCVFEPSPQTVPPRSGATFTQEDFNAANWLDNNDDKLAAIRLRIQQHNPKWPADRIVLLPHLPSGAKAPSYPASISERDLSQVVMVVPKVDGGGLGGDTSLSWSLTRCESIPNYRIQGDFAALATGQSALKTEREYELVRVGHVMSCGADELTYSLLISSSGGPSREPTVATVPVRPVYHLGATAMFGFDATKQSSFLVRGGKIDEVEDRVGPGLLVGGTYFVKGVDYGDMRWYNHFINPFLVISLEAPKDRFVVGTALTYRGGISLALGAAFNHAPVLASGYVPGQAFTGDGDIPLDKDWKTGFYIGIAVDDKLFASVSKLKKTSTGGGTKPGSAEKAKTTEEEAAKKKAEEAAAGKKKGSGVKDH